MALTTLANYTTQVQRLLHDSAFQFWSQAELTDYINAGRARLVRDTACVRTTQICNISTQVESYSFGSVTGAIVNSGGSGYVTPPTVTISGGTGAGATATAALTGGVVTAVNITNGGTGYSVLTQGAVAPTITFGSGAASATATVLDQQAIDCVGVSYIFGSSRLALQYRPWREFNAKYRYYTSNIGRPEIFSVYAYVKLFIWRLPDQPYLTELDVVTLPAPLIDNTTPEQIPYIFQDPVQYYAAFMAKMKSQQMREADEHLQRYKQSMMACLASIMTKRTRSEYYAW
jgi:hypothetical protein